MRVPHSPHEGEGGEGSDHPVAPTRAARLAKLKGLSPEERGLPEHVHELDVLFGQALEDADIAREAVIAFLAKSSEGSVAMTQEQLQEQLQAGFKLLHEFFSALYHFKQFKSFIPLSSANSKRLGEDSARTGENAIPEYQLMNRVLRDLVDQLRSGHDPALLGYFWVVFCDTMTNAFAAQVLNPLESLVTDPDFLTPQERLDTWTNYIQRFTEAAELLWYIRQAGLSKLGTQR